MENYYIRKPKECMIPSMPQYKWIIKYRFPDGPYKRALKKTKIEADKFYEKTKREMSFAVFVGTPQASETESSAFLHVQRKAEQLGKPVVEIFREYRDACKILEDIGEKPIDACEAYAKFIFRRNKGMTLNKAMNLYYDYIKTHERRERYTINTQTVLNSFEKIMAKDFPVSAITSAQIKDFIANRNYISKIGEVKTLSPYSKRIYRNVFCAFFDFLISRFQVCEDNPASTCNIHFSTEKHIKEIYKLEDIISILENTEQQTELRAYIALCCFAGARFSEIKKLRWKHIDMAKSEIVFSTEVANIEHRRIVHMPKALEICLEQLSSSKDQYKLVITQDMGHEFEKLMVRLNITRINDGLRKSFAAYHLAHYDKPEYTATQLGCSKDSLLENYIGMAKKDDADLFFSWPLNNYNENPS